MATANPIVRPQEEMVERMLGSNPVVRTQEEQRAWLEERSSALKALVDELESALRSGVRNRSKGDVDTALAELNSLYSTFMDELTNNSLILNDSPLHVNDFTEENKAAKIEAIIREFNPSAETRAEVEHILHTFCSVSHLIETMKDWDTMQMNPGVIAATVQSAYDDHISAIIESHTAKSAQRNEQIKVIDRHVSALHRQVTSGNPIDQAVTKTHLEALHGIRDDLLEEYPELTEYFELPEITDDTVIDEDFIRDYMSTSDMLKARLHSSHTEHANEINKLHQLYILVVDVMKNMQKMQHDATSAIIRRTGQ